MAGLLLAIPIITVGSGRGDGGLPTVIISQEGEILDPPGLSIMEAKLSPMLVHLGTTRPYTGYGPPGLALGIDTPGNVLDWTIVGWANRTSPPAMRLCHADSMYFGAYDWLYVSSVGMSGSQAAYISTPSTVQQRIGPDGDQCLLRVLDPGDWHITICGEGKRGGPLGRYRDEGGRLHYDAWDRCESRDVKV